MSCFDTWIALICVYIHNRLSLVGCIVCVSVILCVVFIFITFWVVESLRRGERDRILKLTTNSQQIDRILDLSEALAQNNEKDKRLTNQLIHL
jgi:Ca2+/Na+ antiporter